MSTDAESVVERRTVEPIARDDVDRTVTSSAVIPMTTVSPGDPRLRRWSFPKRFAFRFALVYFLLYTPPFLISALPYTDTVMEWYGTATGEATIWIADTVFAKEVTGGMSGSGDRTFNWVQIGLFAAVALVAASLWSLAMPRKKHHAVLGWFFWVACRYYLAIVMFTYGFAKILPGQFRPPGFSMLLRTYGESSPMGILWTFMGASVAFTIFTGIGEVLGGALLLFRRTATLGAAVVIGVMSGVVMLNFSYDVPVKQFSSHLLFMALVLVAIDGRRVLRLFVLNRATEPRPLGPPFRSQEARAVVLVLEVAALIALVVSTGIGVDKSRAMYAEMREQPPLYGLYEVTSFTREGEDVPPLVTDASRWRYFMVERAGSAAVRDMTGTTRYYKMTLDEDAKHLELASWQAEEPAIVLDYERTDDTMTFSGTMDDVPVEMVADVKTREDFLLVNRGFHWINEVPYNR